MDCKGETHECEDVRRPFDLRDVVNWRAKILAKIVLSRLPVPYGVWRKVGAFRHGAMDSAEYSIAVVMTHFERFGGAARVAGATCLELGPGDSLSSALVARAFGARQTFLVDVGQFADRRIGTYRKVAAALRTRGLDSIDVSSATTCLDILRLTNATYLTRGLESLRSIPSKSVDLIWSHAVLEHVRRHELDDTLRELHRILRPDGSMSHRIDFTDHLGGGLNNLRFRTEIWESDFVARSGFYTNRVRYGGMVDAMRRAGFSVTPLTVNRWDSLPLARKRMAADFASLPEAELLVSGCDLIATPDRGARPTRHVVAGAAAD